jgi:hypothetical protein
MRRILFASVAVLALVTAPAGLAQQVPVPATPPIVSSPPDTNVTPGEAQPSATPQTPSPQASVRNETQTDVTATPAPQAEARTTTQAQTATPSMQAQTQAQTTTQPDPTSTAPRGTAQTGATAATPSATATQAPTATAEAATTTTTPSANAATQTAEAATVAATGVTPTPANAQAVCAARSTSVHFGNGSRLSRPNQNAIEYAADAASVCNLQSVTIADSGNGRVSARRIAAVRQTLIRQGVPQDRIQVEHSAEGAATGQLDVRMTFAGAAQAGPVTASNETTTATPPPASPGGS